MKRKFLFVSILLFLFLSCGDSPGVEELMPLIMGLFGLGLIFTIVLFVKVVIIDQIIKIIRKRKKKEKS